MSYETPVPLLAESKARRAYIWTFIAPLMVVHVFNAGRSGETPKRVLGTSPGFIQADGFSGVSPICMPDGRTRVGWLGPCTTLFLQGARGGIMGGAVGDG